MLAELAFDVLREPGPVVVHRDDDPGDLQVGVELATDQLQRVEELDQALERQVLGLDRDDHLVGRDQRVDRDRAERGRAVEERVGEPLAHRAEAVAEAALEVVSRGSSTEAPARSALAGTIHRLSGPAGRAASATESRRSGTRRGGLQVLGSPSATVALHWASGRRSASGARPGDAAPMFTVVSLADPTLLVRDRVDGAHQGTVYVAGNSISG